MACAVVIRGRFPTNSEKVLNRTQRLVGYCGMSEDYCSNCWANSIEWQVHFSTHLSWGSSIKNAFEYAMISRPMCFRTDGSCMRLAGDPYLTLVPIVYRKLKDACSQIETENFTVQAGIQTQRCSEGGVNIGWINSGDWIMFNNVDFGCAPAEFQARVASRTSGGDIEIRLDGVDGPLLGTCPVDCTGGWQSWTTQTCAVSAAGGVHDLYFVFSGGTGYLFNVNWVSFFEEPVLDACSYQIEAENYTDQAGIQTEPCSEGGEYRLGLIMVIGSQSVMWTLGVQINSKRGLLRKPVGVISRFDWMVLMARSSEHVLFTAPAAGRTGPRKLAQSVLPVGCMICHLV